MNDVLAVLMLSLGLDFCEDDSIGDRAFLSLHSPVYFWSEAYAMYSAIMSLGVNKIYYKENPNEEKPKNVQNYHKLS